MRPLPRTLGLGLLLAIGLAGAATAEVRHVRLGTRPGDVHRGRSAVLMRDGRFAAVGMQGASGTTAFVQYVDADGTRAFGLPGRAVATSPLEEGGEAVIVAHAQAGVLPLSTVNASVPTAHGAGQRATVSSLAVAWSSRGRCCATTT